MNNINILKLMLLSAITLLILSCSSKPEVHVYARYLTDIEKQNISRKIEELGFSPIVNNFEFPPTITASSIIYSPLLRDSSNVNLLMNGMSELNINVNSVDNLVSGNHWYTKDSIALLVLPEQVANGRIRSRDLVNSYISADCEMSIKLELFESGLYTLSGHNWQANDLSLTKGTWEYRQYPYLELRPQKGESWYRYYEIVESIEQDKVSKIEMLKLVPLTSHQLASDCQFINGTRM